MVLPQSEQHHLDRVFISDFFLGLTWISEAELSLLHKGSNFLTKDFRVVILPDGNRLIRQD